MEKESPKTYTAQLRNADRELWRRILAAAILDGITYTEWVERLAKEKLDKEPEPKP